MCTEFANIAVRARVTAEVTFTITNYHTYLKQYSALCDNQLENMLMNFI